MLGDLARGRALHEEALALRRAIGDPILVIGSLEGLGQVANLQGDHEDARRYLQEALSIAEAEEDSFHRASVMWNLGVITQDSGDVATARMYYERGLELLPEHHDEVSPHLMLSVLAYEQGDFDEAETMGLRALARYRGAGSPRLEALALATLGGVVLARGDRAAAREHLCASIGICQELGDIASIGQIAGSVRRAGLGVWLLRRRPAPRRLGDRSPRASRHAALATRSGEAQ